MPSSTLELVGSRTRRSTQILASLAVAFGPFSAGLGKGYTSPALASLQREENSLSSHLPHLTVSQQEGSWIASLSLLGALVGGLLSSQILKYGRKNCLLFVSVPFSLSWTPTVFAHRVEMIYCTAFLAGLCSAVVTLVSQVYISEISHPDLRGRLSSSLKIFSHLGLLASFLMGKWLDWRQLALVCASAPLMMLITLQYIPETPSHLVYSGRVEEAEQSLLWLRGDNADMSAELATIQVNIRRGREQGSGCRSVLLPQLLKPVLLTSTLMFFNRFSGIVPFNFYAVTIFSSVFGDLDPHLAAVTTAVLQLISSCLSGVLADYFGRKPVLLVSSMFMVTALVGFGLLTFYLDIHSPHYTGVLDWLPLVCVLVFSCSFSVGIQPVSWLLVGELFPLQYRATGTSITTAFSYGCAALSVKTFVDLQQLLGLHGTFWTYSAISAAGMIFYLLWLPETRGKTLQEMVPEDVLLSRENKV